MNADKLMLDIRKSLKDMIKNGDSYRTLHLETGVSYANLWKIVKKEGVDPRISTVAALVNYLGVEVES